MSKERPILFSASMVSAIIEGRKSQTRRVVKPQPPERFNSGDVAVITNGPQFAWSRIPMVGAAGEAWPPDPQPGINCPYGVPGDRLIVKESYRLERKWDDYSPATVLADIPPEVWYEADPRTTPIEQSPWGKLRPSIHMPFKISRLTLEVTEVRVERLQEITVMDIEAEGCSPMKPPRGERWSEDECWAGAYGALWESINGPGSWASNPWVWVIGFKVAAKGGGGA